VQGADWDHFYSVLKIQSAFSKFESFSKKYKNITFLMVSTVDAREIVQKYQLNEDSKIVLFFRQDVLFHYKMTIISIWTSTRADRQAKARACCRKL
jgi:hypothetical protein